MHTAGLLVGATGVLLALLAYGWLSFGFGPANPIVLNIQGLDKIHAVWGHVLARLVFLPFARFLYALTQRQTQFTNLMGLQQPVDVRRDGRGVPYITAHTLEDAIFAQGFLHARDRPWQMEMLRLAARGRLSEALGREALKSDYFFRSLDFCKTTKLAAPEETTGHDASLLLESYSKGVTAGFKSLPLLPLEFWLTKYSHFNRTWIVEDSLCAFRLLSLAMARGWTIEKSLEILNRRLKFSLRKHFQPHQDSTVPPVNPLYTRDGPTLFDRKGHRVRYPAALLNTQWAYARPEVVQFGEYNISNLPPFSTDRTEGESLFNVEVDGSNAWVVSGGVTASGRPIVSGDPHLALQAPGFWYPCYLGTTSADSVKDPSFFSAIGLSVPGIPGLFIGHNRDVGWSITLNYLDLQDGYVLKLTKNGSHYLYDGRDQPLLFKEEAFLIKGEGRPERRTFRRSHHGPIVSDHLHSVAELLQKEEALALAAVPLRASLPVRWIRDVIRAKTWEDVFHAVKDVQTTGLAVTFGTVNQDIGTFFSGAVPQRTNKEGFRRGWLSEDDWQGVVSPEVIPDVLNPVGVDFLIAANQQVTHIMNPLHGISFAEGSRAHRLHFLLTKAVMNAKINETSIEDADSPIGSKITTDTMQAIQLDLQSYRSEQWMKVMRTVVDTVEKESGKPWCPQTQRIWNAMKQWDYQMDVSRWEPFLYTVWVERTLRLLFEDSPSDAVDTLLGVSSDTFFEAQQEIKNHWRIALENLILSLSQADGSNKHTMSVALLCRSLMAAERYLNQHFKSSNPLSWNFNDAYLIPHALAKAFPLLHPTLSIGPLSTGGDFSTVSPRHRLPVPSSFFPMGTPEPMSYAGIMASARVIMDLGNFSASHWNVPPGVSGWAGTAHYSDQVNKGFVDGTYLPMLWTPEDRQKHTHVAFSLFPVP